MTKTALRDPLAGQAAGTPCWASLLVHDLPASQEFYHELFGWEFCTGPQQFGPYVRATVDGHEVAGLAGIAPGRNLRPVWLPYIASDDADTTASLIRERGGTVAVGPLDTDHHGRLAVAADPSGATFGVWQTAAQGGMDPAEEGTPGTPVWFELVTYDCSSAAHFYPAVFGHVPAEEGGEAASGNGGDYLTLQLDGRPVAGVQGVGRALPAERGPHWKTYFAVEDTDASMLRVRELGGAVVHQPRTSPHGRVATAADPEGAQFSVISPGS